MFLAAEIQALGSSILGSFEHIGITWSATGSLFRGIDVALVDFWPGLQGYRGEFANIHAMGGISHGYYQSCGAAYEGAVAELNVATAQARAGLGGEQLALHTIQDSYASGHGYQSWRQLTSSHVKGDWFPTKSVTKAATDASKRYVEVLHSGRAFKAESFLAPRPSGCN